MTTRDIAGTTLKRATNYIGAKLAENEGITYDPATQSITVAIQADTSEIPDNSITPEKVEADDDQQKARWRARLDAASRGEVFSLDVDQATLASRITDEAGNRATQDQRLSQLIEGERTNRASGDTALGTRISDLTDDVGREQTNRANADTALTQSIADETTARTNADNTLSGRITAEATARSEADTTLDNRITTLESDSGSSLVDALRALVFPSEFDPRKVSQIAYHIYGATTANLPNVNNAQVLIAGTTIHTEPFQATPSGIALIVAEISLTEQQAITNIINNARDRSKVSTQVLFRQSDNTVVDQTSLVDIAIIDESPKWARYKIDGQRLGSTEFANGSLMTFAAALLDDEGLGATLSTARNRITLPAATYEFNINTPMTPTSSASVRFNLRFDLETATETIHTERYQGYARVIGSGFIDGARSIFVVKVDEESAIGVRWRPDSRENRLSSITISNTSATLTIRRIEA